MKNINKKKKNYKTLLMKKIKKLIKMLYKSKNCKVR